MIVKKLLAMILLIAILASCTLALAESAVKLKGSCYVYKKAGSGKTGIILKRGTLVVKIDSKGNWTRIYYDANMTKTGWVRSKYVREATEADVDGEDIPSMYQYASGGQGNSSEMEGEASIARQTVETTGKVNLRMGASLSSKVIRSLKKGTRVTLLGPVKMDSRLTYFYKVKAGGKTGWVSGAYLPKKLSGSVH